MLESRGNNYQTGTGGLKDVLKKVLKNGAILFFLALLVFLLAKTFYLNKPKFSAQEVAILYLKAEQYSYREGAEKYLSDFKNVEVLEEKYEELQKINWFQQKKDGEEPMFGIKSSEINENQARISILEETNKKEGSPFFGYLLPEKVIFDFILEKEGNWKEGYRWKIIKISSSGLVLKKKIGEKVEIKKGIFVEIVSIEDYSPKDVKLPEGIKILSLEIVFENKTENPVKIYSFGGWKMADGKNQVYFPPSVTSAVSLRQPAALGQEVKADEAKKGYIVFEVPKNISPEKIILQRPEKKIIFELK